MPGALGWVDAVAATPKVELVSKTETVSPKRRDEEGGDMWTLGGGTGGWPRIWVSISLERSIADSLPFVQVIESAWVAPGKEMLSGTADTMLNLGEPTLA